MTKRFLKGVNVRYFVNIYKYTMKLRHSIVVQKK